MLLEVVVTSVLFSRQGWPGLLHPSSLSSLSPLQFPITALREIKILQLLKHENVVNLIEICRTKGSLWSSPLCWLLAFFPPSFATEQAGVLWWGKSCSQSQISLCCYAESCPCWKIK